MQKEDLGGTKGGDVKGYPVLESGRCRVPDRTGRPDGLSLFLSLSRLSSRGIINQNIYAQGTCEHVRRRARRGPTLRLIDYPMSRRPAHIFGIQGVPYTGARSSLRTNI